MPINGIRKIYKNCNYTDNPIYVYVCTYYVFISYNILKIIVN